MQGGVKNLILGYPALIHKNFGTFFGEIHRVNPEILRYLRIPGYPLTSSLIPCKGCYIIMGVYYQDFIHIHPFRKHKVVFFL